MALSRFFSECMLNGFICFFGVTISLECSILFDVLQLHLSDYNLNQSLILHELKFVDVNVFTYIRCQLLPFYKQVCTVNVTLL